MDFCICYRLVREFSGVWCVMLIWRCVLYPIENSTLLPYSGLFYARRLDSAQLHYLHPCVTDPGSFPDLTLELLNLEPRV